MVNDRLARRAMAFDEALRGVEEVIPYTPPEAVLCDRRLLSAGLITRNALYVSQVAPEEFDVDAATNDMVFEPDWTGMLGATDSLHGVVFGRLYTSDTELDVAVKPHDSSRAGAVRELAANEFMIREGMGAYRPLGIVGHDGSAFLVTVRDRAVTTFDNIAWNRDPIGDHPESYRHSLLGGAAASTAKLQALGGIHNDAQPKNVALSEEGTVTLIDLEGLEIPPQVDVLATSEDVATFYRHLHVRYGYGCGESAEMRFSDFYNAFVDPYAAVLHEELPDRPELVDDMVGAVVDRLTEFIFTSARYVR